MWWETVGWLLARGSSRLQEQISPCEATSDKQAQAHRVGQRRQDPGQVRGLLFAERSGSYGGAAQGLTGLCLQDGCLGHGSSGALIAIDAPLYWHLSSSMDQEVA